MYVRNRLPLGPKMLFGYRDNSAAYPWLATTDQAAVELSREVGTIGSVTSRGDLARSVGSHRGGHRLLRSAPKDLYSVYLPGISGQRDQSLSKCQVSMCLVARSLIACDYCPRDSSVRSVTCCCSFHVKAERFFLRPRIAVTCCSNQWA